MSALDDKIDGLYQLPLGEFTAARNALAKSLSGEDAKRVRALEKPTIVPWSVNQVYWHARSTYDRLMKSGEKLRAVQIAALEGRAADVRAASEAHRRAIGDAVAEAERLSAAAGAKPGADSLARTFESLSLTASAPKTPGRLRDALQPAGFEALLGVTPSDSAGARPDRRGPTLEVVKSAAVTTDTERRTNHDERRMPNDERKAARAAAEKEAARVAKEQAEHAAAVKAAEADLARAADAEQKAREIWERAHDDLLAARQALTDLRRRPFKSSD